MSRFEETPRVAMQVTRNVVVASIQIDLDDDVLARFRRDLLARVHETRSRAVILDVSGVATLDSTEFTALRRTIDMVGLMGSETLLVGLQPGVVSALIEMNVEVSGLKTALDLDEAFDLLEPVKEDPLDPEPDAGPDADSGLETSPSLDDEISEPEFPFDDSSGDVR